MDKLSLQTGNSSYVTIRDTYINIKLVSKICLTAERVAVAQFFKKICLL